MKVVRNTCDEELDCKMKSVKEIYLSKSSHVNFQNSWKIFMKDIERKTV